MSLVQPPLHLKVVSTSVEQNDAYHDGSLMYYQDAHNSQGSPPSSADVPS